MDEKGSNNSFWDLIDSHDMNHLEILLNEIKEVLCSFVPSRKDIHEKIELDLNKEIGWNLLMSLLKWIEMFQAPVHDNITKTWYDKIKNPSLKLSDFLKFYYNHVQHVYEETFKYRKRIANGENIFEKEKPSNTNGVPDSIKTGR